MKYLQILFYYVQDAVLFKIESPTDYNSKTENVIVKILQFSPEVLAVYADYSNVCVAYATSAVSKNLLRSIFGPCVVFLLFIVYFILKLLSKLNLYCISCYSSASTYLIQTFLLIFLMSYQQIETGAFALIQCVEVQENRVLHVQGDIQCYTWWQIAVKVFLVFNIFPLLLVFSQLPFQLKDNKISSKCFILSCVFPIPVLIYILVDTLLKTKKTNNKDTQSSSKCITELEKERKYTIVESILHTLLDHYKCLTILNIRFTWLGVHNLYRLSLVICYTYILEPIPRLSVMISVLFLVTICIVFLKPYKDSKANKTATFSYMANLCIAMINFWKTSLVTFDCKINCTLKTKILGYLQVCESILLIWLPLGVIVISLSFTAICKCVSKCKKRLSDRKL